MAPATMQELLFKYGSDEQIKHIPEPSKLIYNKYDVEIGIIGEENTKALSNVNPTKITMQKQARTDLFKTVVQRSAAGEFRWTVGLFPTNACAQDADMSLSEYEDFVYGACLPDVDKPVDYWQRFSARQQKIVEWLKGKEQLRVVGPDTNLRLSIKERTFINCDGHYNMPDGEIFTGPVEDSVNGNVYFSYPAIYGGREVTGVRLWFEEGKVIKATAEKGEDFLLKTIDTDEGARRVGEFAIGTNEGITGFTRQILFDEKINGSFHMALGMGFPETGSKNESGLHWDMVCDLRSGGEIWVDDELLYKNGKFAIS
jgi:aminopeptidase